MTKFKIAAIQMLTNTDKKENLKSAKGYIKKVAEEGADIVVLGEMFNTPYITSNFPIYGEIGKGESWQALSEAAKDNDIYVVGGSIPEKDEEGRIFNTSFVFDREGNQIARHRKMHLFDIDVEGGQTFRESDTLTAGDEVTVFDTEFGKIGLCICYDFRFPELSRLMVNEGAKVIIVPAAFNMTTGPAHWDILFRTRALDNQVYTIGAAPARDSRTGYTSWGHSMIVDPWGKVIKQLDEKVGYFIEEVDLNYVIQVRDELPMLNQRRLDLYELNKK
ncbi:carbon-nitrogen hydrolase family protein [Peptoniphilus porci]|uniref:Carbon-nitrogen hydrolase n=1 Tax=Peptoniphilus porci TaxID=2652280 RepID=A0A1U7LYC0_9FIRM|nr:carbon-nitrogen hydrolase family protein [Peptoniphilus porci]OLR64348.1 carbon-nitrogen hydrolase [Peptoniphilus porci]